MNEKIKQKLKELTTKSGVYIMHSSSGAVIYVGKAKNLKNRVSQYFNNSPKPTKVMAMVEHVEDFEYFITLSERDAFALENNLIKKYKPFYNILLKDDKAYPYIKVTVKDEYPRLEVVRKIKNDGSKYFGPYISSISPYALIKIVNMAYPLRTCKGNLPKKPKRPCLNYSLGLCSAPCAKYVSKEEYKKIVQKAMDFLRGNDSDIEKILEAKMKVASSIENFERALEIRDMLKMINNLKQKVVADLPSDKSIDVISYVNNGILGAICTLTIRHGKVLGITNQSVVDASIDEKETISQYVVQYYEKHEYPKELLLNMDVDDVTKEAIKTKIICPQKGTKLNLIKMANLNANEYLNKIEYKENIEYDKTVGALEKLKDKLNLKSVPNRIECYDISHISGTNQVASMVVFIAGKVAKNMYRKFKIPNYEKGSNDFESLRQTLIRRFNELKKDDVSFTQKPDLIVIDGGKGQLSSTYPVLKDFNVQCDIISLAKSYEEVYVPNNNMPIMLKRGSSELRLLQNIRDEAHRFAISFHRKLRTKNEIKSPLDEINGLGKVKKQALLNQFKTLDEIKNASVEELNLVKGIDINLAIKIKNFVENLKNK